MLFNTTCHKHIGKKKKTDERLTLQNDQHHYSEIQKVIAKNFGVDTKFHQKRMSTIHFLQNCEHLNFYHPISAVFDDLR